MRSFHFKNFITIALLVTLSFTILGSSFIAISRNYALHERGLSIEDNVKEDVGYFKIR